MDSKIGRASTATPFPTEWTRVNWAALFRRTTGWPPEAMTKRELVEYLLLYDARGEDYETISKIIEQAVDVGCLEPCAGEDEYRLNTTTRVLWSSEDEDIKMQTEELRVFIYREGRVWEVYQSADEDGNAVTVTNLRYIDGRPSASSC